MKNFPFSFEKLRGFSESDPYSFIPGRYQGLYEELERKASSLNFPAIQSDVGALLSFLMSFTGPKRIFEMGSGYGHSAFWYFLGAFETIEEVTLTEKRSDLQSVFNGISWPLNWKNRMTYNQGDAFEALDHSSGEFDFFLIDGVKGDYLSFLEACLPKLSSNGFVAIDNSFWRGSFLDKSFRENKKSARNIGELHDFIKERKNLTSVFVPFADGLSLIRKSND